MRKSVKLSILGVGAAALLGGGAFAASKRGPKATEVKIEPVARRDLVASVTASGQVRPNVKVDVAADISGRIVRLAVKEGQTVSQGQFLLQIDPEQYAAAVARARRRCRRPGRSSRRRRPTTSAPSGRPTAWPRSRSRTPSS
jgi:HlyD family secretion protein